jgi:outer membrane protein OmpA-like peptidoglycan-associated protein
MKNKFKFSFLVVFVFAIGCASTPPPQTQVKEDTSARMPDISSQNEQLTNYSIGGFGYKSSELDSTKWDAWAQKAAPIVKEIIDKLPEGYILQVTGHADASGPEEPEGDKPGNIKLSADRAKAVFDALKKAGIDSPKIKYKGLGSSELLNTYDPRAAGQRRVTFKIVSI